MENLRLFWNYFILAAIASAVDLSLVFILSEAGIFYMLCVVVAYISGTAVNYSLNKKYNFKNKDKRVALQFGVFVSIATMGLAMNMALVFILVEYFLLWVVLARLISMFAVLPYSFILHKKITFGRIK